MGVHMSGDGGGIGYGGLIEAGGKMGQHAREAEMRRGPSKQPHHEPPRRPGFFRKLFRRITDRVRGTKRGS